MNVRQFVLVALLCFSPSAFADTYQYAIDFTPFGDYSFDTDAILTADTTIPAADFTFSNDPTAVSIFINPNGSDCPNGNRGGAACIELKITDGEAFDGFTGPFDGPGTYSSPGGQTLTITDLTPSASTPEPSSLILLGTGALGLLEPVRRKFRKA